MGQVAKVVKGVRVQVADLDNPRLTAAPPERQRLWLGRRAGIGSVPAWATWT
ncbi:hypothetical protein GCM10010345_91820 [Streptomyces canarius]|uniref:Uncharacterized protein n=1 Tax=Streptomyces canarius TaxID=285453 RepID=A0ABQ3DC70_9ACTN|nr:hypothetical protein GCM10010345_91820 [Streptomyces canarius]